MGRTLVELLYISARQGILIALFVLLAMEGAFQWVEESQSLVCAYPDVLQMVDAD